MVVIWGKMRKKKKRERLEIKLLVMIYWVFFKSREYWYVEKGNFEG